MKCQKEYTIDITSGCANCDPPSLIAYYTLDGPSPPWTDSHTGSHDLAYDAAHSFATAAVDTGIISNALFSDSNPPQANTQWRYANSDAAWAGIGGKCLSVRAWYYWSGDAYFSTTAGPFITLIGSGGWNDYKFYMGWGSPGVFAFSAKDSSGTSRGAASYPLAITGWHHFVALFKTACECELYVDGVLSTSNVFPLPLTSDIVGASLFEQNWPARPTKVYGIDEIAIWTGEISPSQILADYNSGAGKTYPDVPGI